MDLVPDFCIKCVKNGNRGASTITVTILVVSTGKFEFEVEESIRVTVEIPEVSRVRKRAEGTVQLVVGDPVVVAGVGVEFR